jgi:nitroreductase
MTTDDVVYRGPHPYRRYALPALSDAESLERAAAFHERLEGRRSVRMFSDRPVPRAIIEEILLAASTAPSGAHRQPWTFVAVSDPGLKAQIRAAAEEEERKNYSGRMPEAWLEALAPLGTDEVKTHLTDAAWVVVVFAQKHGVGPDGENVKHYYVRESVGMACGLLVAAAHMAGLAALTHTPSPMAFLAKLLGRPAHEQAYVVVPIGHPAPDCVVPDLVRKPLDQIAVILE